MDKEKIENFVLYSLAIAMIMATFYISYNYGLSRNTQDEIPIGQEYRVKDVLIGANSTVTVRYYDNDKNMTEKMMATTAVNKFNVVKANNTNLPSIMTLEKIDNHIKYWKVYVSEKQSGREYKIGSNAIYGNNRTKI